MGWDPGILRRYNTTGHFRLLSQLRSELKANPLVRPRDGESIAEVNRSRSLIRAIAEKELKAKVIGERLRQTNNGLVYEFRARNRKGRIIHAIYSAKTGKLIARR